MLDPNLLHHLGKLRQKELIERGQQSASERRKRRNQREKSIMLDPNELGELGRERQRALIVWREDRRRHKKILNQPPLESAAITGPRRVIQAIISTIKSFGEARTVVPTHASRNRREIR